MHRVFQTALFLIIFLHNNLLWAEDENFFGEFQGTVNTEWLPDGRNMKLLSDFTYYDPNGISWIASKDSIVDGASIPKIAWQMIGPPLYGKYRNASVIHDVACQQKKRTWESVHLSFYHAMRASGVEPVKAKIMYAAVYWSGPRWPITKEIYFASRRDNSGYTTKGFTLSNSLLTSDLLTSNDSPLLNAEGFNSLIDSIIQRQKTGHPVTIQEIQVVAEKNKSFKQLIATLSLYSYNKPIIQLSSSQDILILDEDYLSLKLHIPENGYVYIIGKDMEGDMYLLYPSPGKDNFLSKGLHQLPKDTYGWGATEPLGKTKIIAVLSKNKMQNIFDNISEKELITSEVLSVYTVKASNP